MPHKKSPIEEISNKERAIAQSVAMLGTKYLQIEQLVQERDSLNVEIEKRVNEARIESKKIITELEKSKKK